MSVCDRLLEASVHAALGLGIALCIVLMSAAVHAAEAGEPPPVPGELWIPKEHPYLFFDRTGIASLRELANRPGNHRVLAHLVLRDADQLLRVPIPVEPEPGPLRRTAPEGGYDSTWLSIHYEFYEYGHIMRSYPPILAFAYVLTGDEKYAQRAKEWLLEYARWSRWGPLTTPADNQATQAIIGFSIAYDWIYDTMTPEERALVREALAEQARMFYASHGYLANVSIEGRKGSIANNHTWQQQLGLAFAAVALLYEVPEARQWLETEIAIVRDKLIPSSFGLEGEYIDADGGWIYTFFGDALRFAAALKRMGGPDLFADERIANVGHFLARYEEMDTPGWQGISSHEKAAIFAVLAREYRDPVLQFYAAQGGPFARSWNAPDWGLFRTGATPALAAAPAWSYLTVEWDAARGAVKVWLDSVLMEYEVGEFGARTPDRLVVASHGSSSAVEIAGIDVFHIGTGGASLTPAAVYAVEFPPDGDRVPGFVAGEARLVPDPSGHFRYLELRGDGAASIPFPTSEHGVIRIKLRRPTVESGAAIELISGEGAFGVLRFQPGGGAAISILGEPERAAAGQRFDVRQYPGLYNSALWEFVWLDEALQPAPPARDRASKYFADLGQVWLRTAWGSEGIDIRFRSGPEIGKDHGDQNGFTMRAYGQDILPELSAPSVALSQLQYDLYGWYWGSPGHNVIIVDGESISDAASYAATGQISVEGGIQVDQNEWSGAQRGRRYQAEWLAPGDDTKGRIMGVLLSGAYNYAAGEAHRAYVRAIPLEWWLRQLMLLGPGDGMPAYAIAYDDVRTPGGRLSRIDWQLHTYREPVLVEGNRIRMTRSNVTLVTTLVLPDPVEIEVKRTPGPVQGTPFIQARPEGKTSEVRFLAVMEPVRGAADALLEPERVAGENAYGVIVRPAGGGSVQDTAVFRRSVEPMPASAGGVETDGFAALVRTVDDLPRLFALHQGTVLRWRGRELVSADRSVDAAVEVEPDSVRITVRASVGTEVRLAMERRPASIPDGAHYDAASGVVYIPLEAGEHRLTIGV